MPATPLQDIGTALPLDEIVLLQTILRMVPPDQMTFSEDPNASYPEACSIVSPARGCPVVFSSPHSGRFYPQRFRSELRVPLIDLRRVEDAHVDQLIHGVQWLGAGLITANYARSYIDLNRSEKEIDSRMFRDGPPTPAGERSPRVEAGLGCIPRIAASGEDIHIGKLSREDAELRLERAYRPFHRALDGLLNGIHSETGRVILVDCHSMPSMVAGRRIQADIILGNRHGASCDEGLIRLIEGEFGRRGYRVLRNVPYAGGYITQKHGVPVEDRHSIQIEINRRLYLNEVTVELKPGFYRVRDDVLSVAKRILDWAA